MCVCKCVKRLGRFVGFIFLVFMWVLVFRLCLYGYLVFLFVIEYFVSFMFWFLIFILLLVVIYIFEIVIFGENFID